MESDKIKMAKDEAAGHAVEPPGRDASAGPVLRTARRLLVATSGCGLGCEHTVKETEPRPKRRLHALLVVCVLVFCFPARNSRSAHSAVVRVGEACPCP
jgi:hypothetical protein